MRKRNRESVYRMSGLIALYEEKVKTMELFKMLMKRSKEAEENPQILISLDASKVY